MKEKLKSLKEAALQEINSASSQDELELTRVKYLGRKGMLADITSKISTLTPEEKPEAGKLINEVKKLLQENIINKTETITKQTQKLGSKDEDLTMPGYNFKAGHIHPITQTLNKICSVFTHMGFGIVEGPEIETEHNNFEALNIPLDHPSRDAFDTFYVHPHTNLDDQAKEKIGVGVQDKLLLRSHTSPVQIRYMEKHAPPFAIIVPGKVYRPDAVDASHSFMFYQVEGLMVGENINFAHLKGVLLEFAKLVFGEDTKTRFRPHFFPFTEPSAEMDVSCMICKGAGCSVCSQKGWLEILGAGMVDPAVFEAVGIDSEKYSGFAFGMGVERIAMLKYGINDIRLFSENDTRFLEQF
jgi:phenylalanyl-tRNA synthetase alpha chain